MLAVVVFCATTFASECINCICYENINPKKVESNCCSSKKVKSCCNKENNNCENETKKECDNCIQCVIKKNDIENPISTNENKTSNTKLLKLENSNLSLIPVGFGFSSFNSWRPSEKNCKIFLSLSNFRI